MSGHGQKMTRKQELAIAALLSQGSIEAAAKSINIGNATLRRWMKDLGFRAEYRNSRKEALDAATGQLQQLTSAAANALKAVIEDGEVPHSARVAASRAVFEIAHRGLELEDFDQRLGVIERALNCEGEGATPIRSRRR